MRLLVKWQDGGLSPAQHPEHSQYLDGLTKQLTTQLQSTISQIIDEDEENVSVWVCFSSSIKYVKTVKSKYVSINGSIKGTE